MPRDHVERAITEPWWQMSFEAKAFQPGTALSRALLFLNFHLIAGKAKRQQASLEAPQVSARCGLAS
jgi:hypothetical protein